MRRPQKRVRCERALQSHEHLHTHMKQQIHVQYAKTHTNALNIQGLATNKICQSVHAIISPSRHRGQVDREMSCPGHRAFMHLRSALSITSLLLSSHGHVDTPANESIHFGFDDSPYTTRPSSKQGVNQCSAKRCCLPRVQ